MSDNQKRCAFCGKEDSNLKLCGACKSIRYCSAPHQKQHWGTHKLDCRHLKKKTVKKSNECAARREEASIPERKELSVSLDKSLLDSVLTNQQYSNGILEQEDLSTPIDSEMGVEDIRMPKGSPQKSQSLYQLKLTPDSHSLAEQLGPLWLADVTSNVLTDLNKFGFCAIDNFLGQERALKVLSEVTKLHNLGVLSDGQVVSKQVQAQATGMVRGDKIAWVSGAEEGCETIRQLVSSIDSVVTNANKHQCADKLAEYNITLRTRAMVACYPGGGAKYVKHVDNPNGDGRCVTAIYYINENWRPEDGGVLRIYPEEHRDKVAKVDPIFDRMLFFWSDKRNPHEVLPSRSTRYAITVWYLDQRERDQHHRASPTPTTPTTPTTPKLSHLPQPVTTTS